MGFLLLDLIFSFLCIAFYIVVCPFSLAIVLSVLRFTDSDYLFGIFKLFLYEDHYLVLHGSSRMGNIKYKDEMDLIYMLIDLIGIRNITEQDESDIGIM